MSTVDDLVRQVQQLENATTDLLDATNVSKQTLDEAVDSATGSAGSAKTDAATATEAKNEGVQARNEAVKARDDAEAIAYEGEATTEPGGGKIPVAYADGQIDSGWLPLLQAMYPYSGVIGSVNKLDVLAFGQSENWVNRTQLVAGVRFNIAGRFVEQKTHKSIPLPEAESTAERAIAFDDIFIDWNGNIDTYRSITPHRTTTGYDSDAIATEHGYTKVQNGLYRTGDTYVLLLGRVARRNQGAYHPLWNPEGTAKTMNISGSTTANNWFSSNVKNPSSSADCFTFWRQSGDETPGNIPPFAAASTGYISAPSSPDRPDNKFYDAIYADDFTPLYYSAKNIVDRQALLFDSFNKAVAGETFIGAEGTQQLFIDTCAVEHNPSSPRFRNMVLEGYSPTTSVHYFPNHMVVYNITKGALVNHRGQGSNPTNDLWLNTSREVEIYTEGVNEIEVGDVCMFSLQGDGVQFLNKNTLPSARPQFLAVDVIGSLDDMPQEWLDSGLPGNWLAVGEEGEDLIPDGTEKNFKLSRKCLDCYQVLHSSDNGETWSNVTSAVASEYESAANSVTRAYPEGNIYLISYRTAANPFALSVNSNVISLKSSVFATQTQKHDAGCLLASHLINKVPIDPDGSTLGDTLLTRYVLNSNVLNNGLSPGKQPEHPDLFIRSVFQRPTVKVMQYLTVDNSIINLQCVYKELKNDGTDWGDDNKFNIVDYQSTATDLNGETVIVGQKRCALPYHFGDTY